MAKEVECDDEEPGICRIENRKIWRIWKRFGRGVREWVDEEETEPSEGGLNDDIFYMCNGGRCIWNVTRRRRI